MAKFNKFWLAVSGNILGIVLVYLGFKGIATCGVVDDATTCSLFGLTYVQIQATVQAILNSLLVLAGPANKTSDETN